jgi:hypothetical protein
LQPLPTTTTTHPQKIQILKICFSQVEMVCMKQQGLEINHVCACATSHLQTFLS